MSSLKFKNPETGKWEKIRGGGNKVLHVQMLTYDESTDTFTVDKTPGEIVAAYDEGLEVLLIDTLTNGEYEKIGSLANINTDTGLCRFTLATHGRMYRYNYDPDVGWVYERIELAPGADGIANMANLVSVTYLGDFEGKTIADLRAALDNWLDSCGSDVGVCQFSAHESFVDLWDENDETATIEAGCRWTCNIIGGCNDSNYVQLMVSSYYTNGVRIFTKQDGTWLPIRTMVTDEFNGDFHATGNVQGNYVIGEWLKTQADTHRSDAATKFAVLDGSGWVYHRTAEELRGDVGAAPAGYGYGEVLTLISGNDAGSEEALEAALEEQFNKLKVGEAVQIRFQPYPYVPAGIAGTTFVGTLFRHDTSYAVLHCTSYFGWGCSKTRWSTGWKPIEWINPPMNLGVEYRTTERYLGKPVYVKAIDFGALPAATHKGVAHGASNVDKILPPYGQTSEGWTIPTKSYGGSVNDTVGTTVDVVASTSEIYINTNRDRSSVTATVVIKYTKTTD